MVVHRHKPNNSYRRRCTKCGGKHCNKNRTICSYCQR